MQLTVGKIHALFAALKTIDSHEQVKLKGTVRLDLAINLNRLEPIAVGYERARARAVREFADGKPFLTPVQEAVFIEHDAALRERQEEVALKTIARDDLRLDDNRITAATIQAIAPIIADFDG